MGETVQILPVPSAAPPSLGETVSARWEVLTPAILPLATAAGRAPEAQAVSDPWRRGPYSDCTTDRTCPWHGPSVFGKTSTSEGGTPTSDGGTPHSLNGGDSMSFTAVSLACLAVVKFHRAKAKA